ncbi:MAG: hypothetical protein ABFD25_04395 [Clostridiaceae bacterium]
MRVAVLFNPDAGSNMKFRGIGAVLSKRLKGHEVLTCRGSFGKLYLPDAAETYGDVRSGYRDSITDMTSSLVRHAPELFICVGGDGLASYAADTLITNGCVVPIMGVAGGTANVGPIIAVSPEMLEHFDPKKLAVSSIGAIHVNNGCNHLGYAFNDVIIGNTFLGTVNGKTANLSVETLLKKNEKKVVEAPSDEITADTFKITKNGSQVKYSIERPAQIIASPLEVDNFYGRAITGILCYSAHMPLKAAIGLYDEVIVKMHSHETAMEHFTKVEHLLFGQGDHVSISGLSGNGHIIIDGNPYLREDEVISLEYMPNLLNIAKPVIQCGLPPTTQRMYLLPRM